MSEMDTAAAILATATDFAASSSPDSSVSATHQSDDALDSTSGAVDSPASSENAGEGEGAGDGTQPGEKLPTTQQIRSALKAFREASPDHAQATKLLNDGYSRYEAYKENFATVDEARAVRAQLDTIGGLEGLAEMQGVVTSIEETDALLDAGDPKVIDQIAEDAPEGFVKLAPAYLSKLQKLNPEAFATTVQPYLVQGLEGAGLPQVLSYLASKLTDKPELAEIVRNTLDWYNQQKQVAERSHRDLLNPERQRVQDQLTEVQKERREMLESTIAQSTDAHIRKELGTRLAPYAASLNTMPSAQRADVARACITTLAAALEADKAFQGQVNAMLGARRPDTNRIISFNRSKVSALADNVIAAVVKNYGLKPGAAPVRRTGTRTQNGNNRTQDDGAPKNIVQLSQPPRESDIDWNHKFMTTEAYIKHRAVLKDGRWVKW